MPVRHRRQRHQALAAVLYLHAILPHLRPSVAHLGASVACSPRFTDEAFI